MPARITLVFLVCSVQALFAQAIPTASRAGDAQIGIGYTNANPDYVHQRFPGYAIFGDFSWRPNFGVEAEYHQVFSTNGDRSFERTYEIGGRYFHSFGPIVPYVKAMYGRGDFQYPFGYTELGYNIFAAGAGADFKMGQHVRIRGEYEFQNWMSFPNGGFRPQLLTVGVAYHFDGKPGSRR